MNAFFRNTLRQGCRPTLAAALLVGLLSTPNYSLGQAAKYAPATLGIISNPASSTVVRRVNSLGEAAGGYRGDSAKQTSDAFLLTGATFDLITDGQLTDFSTSYDINNSGEIAGAINGPVSLLPFRSVRQAQFQLLPLLAGDTGGAAYGINDNGEAVGVSTGKSGVHAAWWTRKGQVAALPTLPDGSAAKALDINTKGDIVGYVGESATTAVLWPNKGNVIPLDNLATYTSSQADSISDKGDVVGSATAYDTNAARMRAVLWHAGSTQPQDLGVLAGGTTSRARDVDSNGLVVGTSESSQGNRAFIWSAANGMQDLNSLSTDPNLVLVDALSITKQGAILAIGISLSDNPPMHAMHTMVAVEHVEERELPRHIVLLTPVK